MAYTHGGDVFSLEIPVLDFSISLNPMGMPPCAAEAAKTCLEEPPRYPDPLCRRLKQAIALRDGVEENQILCGNGASDLIDRLIRSVNPKCALITAPTFSEYEKVLETNGCKVNFHYVEGLEELTLSKHFLKRITPGIDLVFLCDPNNPNGVLLNEALLKDILARCREVGALLAVDQCFLELTRADPRRLISELSSGGIILIRALTKSYAMAGLRVGYCLSSECALLARMADLSQPWAVSAPAQAAAAAALLEAPDWPGQCLGMIEHERQHLSGVLTELGAKVFHSDANFLLFCWKDDRLKENLLKQGILIRQCGDYHGLDDRFFRISIRTAAENDRLIKALKNCKEG